MGIWSRLRKEDDEGDLVQAEDVPVEEAERYCCADVSTFSVGDNSHLVYNVSDRSPQIISSHLAALLENCQTFKTLDRHARECALIFEPSGEEPEAAYVEMIKDQLAELVESRLMISETELLDLCRTTAQTAVDPPPIATIGVVTRNRRQSLERCLRSYIENSLEYGRKNDFAVMDDTQEALERAATREMLQELKREYGVEMRYAGAEEKQEYARALIESGDLPSEVVNFALFDVENCGGTWGANRNALLLDTAGDMIFSADDDTVCRIAVAPEQEIDSVFDSDSDEQDTQDFWFYPDRETALRSARYVEANILAIHEQMLGREIAACVARYGEVEVLSHKRLNFLYSRSLQSMSGRVLVTFTGALGDVGMPPPPYLFSHLLSKPESLERLIQSEDHYLAVRYTREVLRLSLHPKISDRTLYNSTSLGCDNRSLLPPFIPVGRGEDFLFADTLRVCFENGYFGDLPFALQHLPMDHRPFSPEDARRDAMTMTPLRIISACMTAIRFWPRQQDGPQRLRLLGKHLMEIGSMELPDFEEFVRTRMWQLLSRSITRMEDHLRDYGEEPDYWAEDVKDYLETLRESLPQQGYNFPADWVPERSTDEARQLTPRLIFKFGQLLYSWPEIVATARELRAQGRRLGVAV